MRRDPVWADVESLLSDGTAPLITVAPSARVVVPKKRGARSQDTGWPTSKNSRRIRCRAAGCYKRLGRKHTIVCSTACETALREECTLMLAILDGKVGPRELPPYMRTNRLKRKPTL